MKKSGYNRVKTKTLFMKHDMSNEDGKKQRCTSNVQHVQGDKVAKSTRIVRNSLPQEQVKDKLNFMSYTTADSSDILALNNIPSMKPVKDGIAKISKELELVERWDMVRIIYVKHNRVRSLVFKVSKPKLQKDLDLLTLWAQSRMKNTKIKVEFATKEQILEFNVVKKRSRRRDKKKSRRKHRKGSRSLSSMSAKSLSSLKDSVLQSPEKKSENTTPDTEFESRGSNSSVYSHHSTSPSPHRRNRSKPEESGRRKQRSFSLQTKSVQSISPFDVKHERKRSTSVQSQSVPSVNATSMHSQSVQSMSPFDSHHDYNFFPNSRSPRSRQGYGSSYHFYDSYGVGRSPSGNKGCCNCGNSPKLPGKEHMFLHCSANTSPKYLIQQGNTGHPQSPRLDLRGMNSMSSRSSSMSPCSPVMHFHQHRQVRSPSERNSMPHIGWHTNWHTQFSPNRGALEGGHHSLTRSPQHHRKGSGNGRMIRIPNMSVKPIKILFLDLKGTLTTSKGSCKLPRNLVDLRPNLAKKLLLLKLVVYLTRCKLVLTGGSKRKPVIVGFINHILNKWGIEPFYSATASFNQAPAGPLRSNHRTGSRAQRAAQQDKGSPDNQRMKEIRYWLDMNPVDSWCVVDALDLSALNEGKRKRFVLVDPRVGLTRTNNKSILEILGVESDLY